MEATPKATTTETRKPLVLADGEKVDSLATYETTRIRSRQLRSGMLLVDAELSTPIYALDHNTGAGTWLAENLENGRYETLYVGPTCPVAAR